MAVQTDVVQVADPAGLEQAVTGYMSQGYSVLRQQPTLVVLGKNRELKWSYLIVGFLLCTIPGVAYLIWYSQQKDRRIEVRIVPLAEAEEMAKLKVGLQKAREEIFPQTGQSSAAACPTCNGSGYEPNSLPWENWRKCHACGGSGQPKSN